MTKSHSRIASLIIVAIIGFSPVGSAPVSKWLNLYVLDFDNLRSDPSLDWLSNGLVDMLRQNFGEVEGVTVFGRNELESILQDRSRLLRQPSGSRNILAMGSFARDLDRISVNVQLINVANWQELGKLAVRGSLNQIAALSDDIFARMNSALREEIPAKQPGMLQEPLATAERPEHRQQMKEMNRSLSSALDDLEEAMDVYIGAREMTEGSGISEGKYYRDFSFNASGDAQEMLPEEVGMLESILSMISKNPYEAEIDKPMIEIDDREEKDVRISVPIKYSLRDNLIKDMLSSLPYTRIHQKGTLTTLEFSRQKFRIPDDLVDRISRGKFRVVPVIQLLDADGRMRSVILDTSDPYWHKQTDQNVTLTTEHIFSPLVAFTVGSWTLEVTMEAVDIHAMYHFEVPRNEVAGHSRIQVEFVPETELSQFLSQIL